MEEGEGEKHRRVRDTFIICILRAFNWGPGLQHSMCPDWESNFQPFGVQQPTEPHRPGHPIFNIVNNILAYVSFLICIMADSKVCIFNILICVAKLYIRMVEPIFLTV